jgi:hypothetical protein
MEQTNESQSNERWTQENVERQEQPRARYKTLSHLPQPTQFNWAAEVDKACSLSSVAVIVSFAHFTLDHVTQGLETN